jgi:Ca2+-binding RTX toxin-like protein
MIIYNAFVNLSTQEVGSQVSVLSSSGPIYSGEAANVGDVNGDGFSDYAIGYADKGVVGGGSGIVYVLYGTASGLPGQINLSNLSAEAGFKITTTTKHLALGKHIVGLGDINNDGFADIGLSTSADPSDPFVSKTSKQADHIHIIFGSSQIPANLNLSALDGSNGYTFDGIQGAAHLSGNGDFNSDGVADFVFSFNNSGIFGYGKEATAIINNISYLISVPQKSAGNFGADFVDDVNGDGIVDLAVSSAPIGDSSMESISIFFGRTAGETLNLNASQLDGTNGYTVHLSHTGLQIFVSTQTAGDVNGDGIGDLLIAIGSGNADNGNPDSPSYYETSRRMFVLYGTNSLNHADFDLSQINGENGFEIDLGGEGSAYATAKSVGDFNGDGFDDIAVTYALDPGMASTTYVFFGKAQSFGSKLDLTSLNPNQGFIANWNARKGVSVLSNAGDVNSDGFDDILLNADGKVVILYGHSTITSIDQNNYIEGNASPDALDGQGGNDTLLGLDGDDLLVGGAGNDILDGGNGHDTLIGGEGDDAYVVESLANTIQDSSGRDELRSEVVSISLKNWESIEDVRLLGVEDLDIYGDSEDNILMGNSGSNFIYGDLGDDSIFGGDGNDTLNGTIGTDQLFGGKGNDVFVINSLQDSISDSSGYDWILVSNFSVDLSLARFNILENAVLDGGRALNLTGDGGPNILVGNIARNRIAAGAGDDTLDGGGGADVMLGGRGQDFYYIDNTKDQIVESGSDKDTVVSTVNYRLGSTLEYGYLSGTSARSLTGNDKANRLGGNDSANTVSGAAGNDTIFGNKGNDKLIGGSGIDALLGGSGSDVLTGGADRDYFILSNNDGRDRVTDFDISGSASQHDYVDLRNLTSIGSYQDLKANHMRQVGNDVVINGDSGDVLTLQGVDLSDLTRDYFFI